MYEFIEGLLEYAPNELIVSMRPSRFLFISDWIPVRHMEQEHQNLNQCCIKPLPGFDMKTFPFVVASGKNYFSLINVKKNLVSQLIMSGRPLEVNINTFLFKKTKYGHAMHFVEDQVNPENKQVFLWYEMQLKKDFFQIL